jgi:hypothetical protein
MVVAGQCGDPQVHGIVVTASWASMAARNTCPSFGNRVSSAYSCRICGDERTRLVPNSALPVIDTPELVLGIDPWPRAAHHNHISRTHIDYHRRTGAEPPPSPTCG